MRQGIPKYQLSIAIALLLTIHPVVVYGQTNKESSLQVLTIDLNLEERVFAKSLPYDELFRIRGKLPKNTIDCVVLNYSTSSSSSGSGSAVWPRPRASYPQPSHFLLRLNHLDPGDEYLFEFQFYEDSLRAKHRTLQERQSLLEQKKQRAPNEETELKELPKQILELDKLLTSQNPDCINIPKTPELFIGGFDVSETPHASFYDHFNTDFGIIWMPRVNYVGIAGGVHFYPFSPINERADLAQFGWSLKENLQRRVSLMAGLAFEEIYSDTSVDIESTTSLGAAYFGIGFRGILYWPVAKRNSFYRRIVQPMRLNIGHLYFQQEDANPIVKTKHLKRDIFVSVTFDFQVQSVLGTLAGLFK